MVSGDPLGGMSSLETAADLVSLMTPIESALRPAVPGRVPRSGLRRVAIADWMLSPTMLPIRSALTPEGLLDHLGECAADSRAARTHIDMFRPDRRTRFRQRLYVQGLRDAVRLMGDRGGAGNLADNLLRYQSGVVPAEAGARSCPGLAAALAESFWRPVPCREAASHRNARPSKATRLRYSP